MKKEKFVPLEKMCKKAKKNYYARQRRQWNGLSPVTRCPPDPKAYNRAVMRREKIDIDF